MSRKNPKLILLGAQGSGKGTQAALLCKAFDLEHISTGDLLRWNRQHHTKLGAKVGRIMAEGLLVPDEIVFGLLSARLNEHDWNYGLILDGFPRTISQGEFLAENWNLDRVVYLDIPREVVYDRVKKRAAEMAAAGNKRDDDNEEALRVRLDEYYSKTEPLIAYYEKKGLLLKVDGTKAIDAVQADIRAGLGL